jgi:ubiquinone biosynthesis protein
VTVTSPDLKWGNFSAKGPWVLDRDTIAWTDIAIVLRTAAQKEVPSLIRSRRIPPLGRLITVVSHLGWAVLPWLIKTKLKKFSSQEESRAYISRRLRHAIEKLGATYIKLAQLISSGEGLFPAELVNEFKRCRDQVPAEPWDSVKTTVEQDLGARIEDVFASFEKTPLAAASIAQVHLATLLSGEEVVVKVQRPSVSEVMRRDLRVMSWIAPIMIGRIKVSSLANPPALVEVFAETIVEELDFRMEASNMIDVAEMLHELKQDSYLVPRPHSNLVTRRVLVMERLQGFRFDDVDGMRAAEIDTELVIRAGLISFMEGALIQGIFHGDLHGGNLFVLEDGRTALLDFGIVGRLVDKRRLAFMRFMLSASTNDLSGQVTALRDLGAFPPDTDIDAVIKDLGIDQPVVDPTTLNSEELVEQGQRIIKALLAYGAKLPKELMLYVKNLVFFDGAIARLAPELDIIGELTNISMIFLQKHGERLSNDLGVDAQALEIDMGSFKAGLGVDESTESMTYRELQERRDLIQKRMRGVSPI